MWANSDTQVSAPEGRERSGVRPVIAEDTRPETRYSPHYTSSHIYPSRLNRPAGGAKHDQGVWSPQILSVGFGNRTLIIGPQPYKLDGR